MRPYNGGVRLHNSHEIIMLSFCCAGAMYSAPTFSAILITPYIAPYKAVYAKSAAEPMGATADFLLYVKIGLLARLLEQFRDGCLNLTVTARDDVFRGIVNLDVGVKLLVLQRLAVAVQRGHLRDAEDE